MAFSQTYDLVLQGQEIARIHERHRRHPVLQPQALTPCPSPLLLGLDVRTVGLGHDGELGVVDHGFAFSFAHCSNVLGR